MTDRDRLVAIERSKKLSPVAWHQLLSCIAGFETSDAIDDKQQMNCLHLGYSIKRIYENHSDSIPVILTVDY